MLILVANLVVPVSKYKTARPVISVISKSGPGRSDPDDRVLARGAGRNASVIHRRVVAKVHHSGDYHNVFEMPVPITVSAVQGLFGFNWTDPATRLFEKDASEGFGSRSVCR